MEHYLALAVKLLLWPIYRPLWAVLRALSHRPAPAWLRAIRQHNARLLGTLPMDCPCGAPACMWGSTFFGRPFARCLACTWWQRWRARRRSS